MASSTRMAMRLLSPRIQYLQRPARCPHQIRPSSRYSNPGKRTFVAEPVSAPSFIGRPEVTESQISPTEIPGPSPSDIRAKQLEWEEQRQHDLRRMRFAGMGLLVSFCCMIVVLYNIDLDALEKSAQEEKRKKQSSQQMDASEEKNRQFQGKEVEVIGVGEDKRVVARGAGGDIELVETGTSSVPHFPRTLYLPVSPDSVPAQPNSAANPGNVDNQEEYTLLGLGIRAVSFLSIQVYVVGMYVRTQDLSALQEKLIHSLNETASTLIPSEKEELRRRLLDPDASREIWAKVLSVPGLKTAWRIAPTRNTDFGHLRDGWITGINNRTREAKQMLKGAETEYESEEFGKAVGDFKTMFTGGKAPKGSIMILSRDAWGKLAVWFQAKPSSEGKQEPMERVGSVSDERISRLIWLGYLAGAKVSSEAARQGVVDGCVGFAGRPIGSAESRVV